MSRKISAKIWFKVVAFLLIGVFLFQQTAYARHYTPDEGLKDFFKSDADQAIMYVAGTVLSIAIPTSGLLGPVSNSTLIISAGVNIGSQVAVASGADPKSTMIVGGAVGGLTSGFVNGGNLTSNLGLQTMVVNVAPWTASATTSAYLGEKNPIVGSLAGTAAGVFTQGFVTNVLNSASTASGHPLTQQEKNDFNQLLNSEGKLAQSISIDSTGPSGTHVEGLGQVGVDAKGNAYFTGNDATLNIDGQVLNNVDWLATMPKPTNIDQTQNPTYVITIDGQPIKDPVTYYKIVTTLDHAFNTQVAPARWESAVRAAAVVRDFGAPLTDVKGNFLYNIDNPFVAGLKNIQTLGPGFLTQSAVQYALYEALDEKPFKMPLINFAGSITGALTNEYLGKFYAGTDYNPWARPPDLTFGQYMDRIVLTEISRAAIGTGFNYLETNIKSDSFPGTTHLLVSAGELVSGALASSLVSLAYPETRELKVDIMSETEVPLLPLGAFAVLPPVKIEEKVGERVYVLNPNAMQASGQKYVKSEIPAGPLLHPPALLPVEALDPALAKRNDLDWVFRETLKDNFQEVLINTIPRFAPSEHVGLGAAGAYMNYVQDTIRLSASATPFFINVASVFGSSMKYQAINDLGSKTGQLFSKSFLPPNHIMYFGVIKSATEPARLAFYNIIEPEGNEMDRLTHRTLLDSKLGGSAVQFAGILENEILKANPDALKQVQERRAFTDKLIETGHLESFEGNAEPYSVTISTYNLALVPTQTYEIRQLKAYDRPKIAPQIAESINTLNARQKELFIKEMAQIRGVPDELKRRITDAIETQNYSALEQSAGDLVALPLDRDSLTNAQELLKMVQTMLPEQRIMQKAFDTFAQEHPESKDLLSQLKSLFTPASGKGPYIKGVAGYTDYLSLYSVTTRNPRTGQMISTQYYRENTMFKTIPIERKTDYFYGPFGLSHIKTTDNENHMIQQHLNLYKVGEVYGRPSPYAALQTTEFEKGAPQLAFLHLIPEITSRIGGILGNLWGLKSRALGGINVPDRDFTYDEERFTELQQKVVALLPEDTILEKLTLGDIHEELVGLVQKNKLEAKETTYFEQCLVYLADNNLMPDNKLSGEIIGKIQGALAAEGKTLISGPKPGIPLNVPISQINEVIEPIRDYSRIFYQAGKNGKLELGSFDKLRETTLAYYIRSDAEKRQDRYELLPSYTIQSGFEGQRPSFVLSARYDYSPNILKKIEQSAREWFNAYGKEGLEVRKVIMEGKELYFISRKGEEDFLYPFASGHYLYNTQEPIPDYLRQILWDSSMLLDENNYLIRLGGFGEPLRYSDYKAPAENKLPNELKMPKLK